MATVSQARFAEWLEEVRAEHMALGMEQGIERGMAQGIERGMAQSIEQEHARGLARLRRHAAIRFGAQTAERLAPLLGAANAAEQLERVGDWIVECESGGDLLARVAAMRPNGGDES